jgi:hypothetical protein
MSSFIIHLYMDTEAGLGQGIGARKLKSAPLKLPARVKKGETPVNRAGTFAWTRLGAITIGGNKPLSLGPFPASRGGAGEMENGVAVMAIRLCR